MKGLGFALIAIGIVLLVIGINASDSFSSNVSRLFTGSPTNKTLWLLLGGAGATMGGAWLAFFNKSR